MTDIAARLRQKAQIKWWHNSWFEVRVTRALLIEAATEIERQYERAQQYLMERDEALAHLEQSEATIKDLRWRIVGGNVNDVTNEPTWRNSR